MLKIFQVAGDTVHAVSEFVHETFLLILLFQHRHNTFVPHQFVRLVLQNLGNILPAVLSSDRHC